MNEASGYVRRFRLNGTGNIDTVATAGVCLRLPGSLIFLGNMASVWIRNCRINYCSRNEGSRSEVKPVGIRQ